MALARFGGGVSELRGSIGGNVFSRSRAGAIVRNRAVPVNPNTPAQSEVRSWMQQATDGFRELSSLEILQWNTFASTQTRFNRLGEPYTPSGKQIFVEAYINNLSVAAAVPPVLGSIEANPNLPSLEFTSVTVTQDSGALDVMSMLGADSNFGDKILVQATGQLPPSISNFQKYYRTILQAAIATPLDLAAGWATIYSALGVATDNVIGFRASAVNTDTGLASEWVYYKATIAATV